MENVLGHIYCWFQSFFGQNLSYFLWGYHPEEEAYTNPNLYNIIGITTLIITIALVVLFYYILSHPKYSKWWSWLITMGINGGIALSVGYGIVVSKLNNGEIPESLVKQFDEEGNVTAILITDIHCWGFGMANAIVAIIAFLLFSLILKWKSTDAKHVPF